MGTIHIDLFTTLDGVAQAPGGPEEDPEGGFPFGGWQAPLFDDVVGEQVGEGMESLDALLLGRKTYDIFAAYWPHQEDGQDREIAVLFNRLVSARQRVNEGWAAIDVQLKRRADLIPNLVEAVRGYAAWERDTLERVVLARRSLTAAGDPHTAARANDELTGALHALFAVAEAYPDLKANTNFLQLQEELTGTEGRIAYARQYYNDSVLKYNTKIQTVPASIIACTTE